MSVVFTQVSTKNGAEKRVLFIRYYLNKGCVKFYKLGTQKSNKNLGYPVYKTNSILS